MQSVEENLKRKGATYSLDTKNISINSKDFAVSTGSEDLFLLSWTDHEINLIHFYTQQTKNPADKQNIFIYSSSETSFS